MKNLLNQIANRVSNWKHWNKTYRRLVTIFWYLVPASIISAIIQVFIEGGWPFLVLCTLAGTCIGYLAVTSSPSKLRGLILGEDSLGMGLIIIILALVGSSLKINAPNEVIVVNDEWKTENRIIASNPFKFEDINYYDKEFAITVVSSFYTDKIKLKADIYSKAGQETTVNHEKTEAIVAEVLHDVDLGIGASVRAQEAVKANLLEALKGSGITEIKSWKRVFHNVPRQE